MNILGLLIELIAMKHSQKGEIAQKDPTHDPHDLAKLAIATFVPQELQMFIGDIGFARLVFFPEY
jgi:hypothetical protein